MSRAWGLVYFPKTNNIYITIYNGTVDVMYDTFITAEECYDSNNDLYNPFKYCDILEEIPETYELFDAEFWTDYGGGFYWSGKASENPRFIPSSYLSPWGIDNKYPIDGTPNWAKNFLEKLNES